MTEPEAYRFIQKTSMDTGRTMLETAQMILLFERDS
jgi:response regulator NasT